jgi:hypothetical protein
LVNKFVFDDPDRDAKINIWADFTNVARYELAAYTH